MKRYDRRDFLKFMGRTSALAALAATLPSEVFSSELFNFDEIKGILPSSEDKIVLAEGLQYEVLISWKDKLNDSDYFGFNNDYIAFVPIKGKKNEAFLWVNHEYVHPMFVSEHKKGTPKTKEQVDIERYNVGGSILKIERIKGKWQVVKNDPLNRRISGNTKIPLAWNEKIENSSAAEGTLANCAGGITPWGNILTCEENYYLFYGENTFLSGKKTFQKSNYEWENFYQNPPEHYGWVVEINPQTGESKKLVAMGRCAHECATVHQTKDKRLVVYSGDDDNDQCLYKFISDKPNSLETGTLYVANLEKGEWIPIVYEKSEILQKHFKNQTEVLVRLREASKLLGGSQLDRPEDIEIDPKTGDVLVALTNNLPKKNYFGSILKITEADSDKLSNKFKHETFLFGGEETGFACPDNMEFDPKGNLWMTSDISGSLMNKAPYEKFKNNGLFVIPMSGKNAGKVIQVASAPKDAEFTGPKFSPDGKTLFLSVQHPGEKSKSLDNTTSNWPQGGNNMPKPSVVMITGDLLKKI